MKKLMIFSAMIGFLFMMVPVTTHAQLIANDSIKSALIDSLSQDEAIRYINFGVFDDLQLIKENPESNELREAILNKYQSMEMNFENKYPLLTLLSEQELMLVKLKAVEQIKASGKEH